MTWRDQLQPASFRGVPFKVESHDKTIGRRVEVHEYPLRDKPYAEDLGRGVRTYNINAYVLGEDYLSQRDDLEEALEKEGPGTLVHRYYGQVRVQVSEVRVRHSNRDGGMARFVITFTEAGEESRPLASIDTRQTVNSRADDAIAAVETEFEDDYSLVGVPGWVSDAAESSLQRLDQALNLIDQGQGIISNVFAVPASISSRTISAIAGLSGLLELNGLRSLWRFGDVFSTVEPTTPSRLRQSNNQQAVANLVERAAIIETARQSTTVDYDSQQNVIAIRDEIADELDLQMATADDDTYLAMQDLRAAVVRDLTDRAAQLKQLRNYHVGATQPALVIAHQLYLNAERDGEIVARNNIAHPGFVTGGRELEVLNA